MPAEIEGTTPAAEARGFRGPTDRFGNIRGLAMFTGMVALLAILSDAAIGHALMWENDPYWTYWITKTFLIATVFGLGTAWLGTGVGRGALITAIHTVVLTIYYWSLSPIGLPSHPDWLDLEHTWVTGLPIHFGVIYLGYLVALWLWRRRPPSYVGETAGTVAADARRSLIVGAGIVVIGGLAEALALGAFPGATWFLVRSLIAVPFILLWWAAAGRDLASAVGGGITLALILATYGHFLGPVGLPDTDLRLLAPDPPPATVHWLSYRDEFLIGLPITLAIAVAGLVAASLWGRYGRPRLHWTIRRISATAVVAVALASAGIVANNETRPGAEVATISSAGIAMVEQGTYYGGEFTSTQAQLRLVAEDRNPRVTPLAPHDLVDLEASVTHPDGSQYGIQASVPMVDDPMGRFGTWWGVGFDVWHHGRSGIGTPLVPATRSNVAVFALGDVRVDGRLIATGVPIHVMTMDHGLELDVGDPAFPLPFLPNGHVRVVWDAYTGGHSHDGENARYVLGAIVLIGLLGLALSAVRSERSRVEQD